MHIKLRDISNQLMPHVDVHFMVDTREVDCCKNSAIDEHSKELDVLKFQFDISMTGELVFRVWLHGKAVPTE